jgi:serine/threonine protein kinase
MMTGAPPFRHKNDNILYKKILNDQLRIPSYVSQAAATLIRSLLNRDEQKRLKVDSIKKHRFFRAINWEKVWNAFFVSSFIIVVVLLLLFVLSSCLLVKWTLRFVHRSGRD